MKICPTSSVSESFIACQFIGSKFTEKKKDDWKSSPAPRSRRSGRAVPVITVRMFGKPRDGPGRDTVVPEIREAGWAAAICRHPQSYFINSPYSRHLVRTMTPPLQRLGLIVALLCPPTISAAGRRQLHARLEEGGQICVAGSAGAAAYAISGKMTTQWQPPGVAYRMLKRQVACAQQRVQVTAMRNTI